MNCSYCSTELPSGAMFCGECGRSVASFVDSSAGSAPRWLTPTLEAQREPELEPAAEREPVPEPVPDPDPAHPLSGETCGQCGTELGPADIFCGVCGFVRQAAGQRPRDTVSLDPFPWGMSGSPAVASLEPSIASPPRPDASGYVDDTDDTRIVDRTRRGERFVLQFSTGESVSVNGTGLLGRNPVPEPGEYVDALVVISDPGKSVSKTHLEFGQDGGSFWVSDRYSGNGTVVREPEAQPRRCDAGKRYRIVRGTRVDIGEQFFIVS